MTEANLSCLLLGISFWVEMLKKKSKTHIFLSKLDTDCSVPEFFVLNFKLSRH